MCIFKCGNGASRLLVSSFQCNQFLVQSVFIAISFHCNQFLLQQSLKYFFSLSHKAKKKPKKSFSISSAFRQSSTNLLGYRTKAETNQTINSTVSESIPLAGGLLPGQFRKDK